MGAQTSKVALEHDVKWYRTKLPPGAQFHTASDIKGFIQTLGFLGMLVVWLVCAQMTVTVSPALSLAFTILYGTQANFLINGMHELGVSSWG